MILADIRRLVFMSLVFIVQVVVEPIIRAYPSYGREHEGERLRVIEILYSRIKGVREYDGIRAEG
jgi:hypothetical protein